MVTKKKSITRAKIASMPKVASPLKDAKTASINVRIAPDTKAKAEQIFDKLGIGMSDAISMFLKQVIHHKGIPFELRVPNPRTRKAMRNAKLGRNITRYESVDGMWKDLGL